MIQYIEVAPGRLAVQNRWQSSVTGKIYRTKKEAVMMERKRMVA